MSKAKKLYESYNWIGEIANRTIIEIKKTADILVEIHNVFFRQYNISTTKFNLLIILYSAEEEGVSLSDIGEQMLVTRANITGLVDRLERQGFVKRIPQEEDRRRIRAQITEEGREFTNKIIEEYKVWSKEIMNIVEDEEKENLVQLLKRMQDAFVQME